MARKILMGVQLPGDTSVFGPGQEDALNKAANEQQIEYLKAKGAIEGDWKPEGKPLAPHRSRLSQALGLPQGEASKEPYRVGGATVAPRTGPVQPAGVTDDGKPQGGVSSAPSRGASGSGSGDSEDERLKGMSVADLRKEADKRKITVTRGDGKQGDPVKADYLKALSAGAGVASEPSAGGEVVRTVSPETGAGSGQAGEGEGDKGEDKGDKK